MAAASGLLFAALIVLAALALPLPEAPFPAAVRQTALPPIPEGQTRTLKGVDAYPDISERTLFSPSRRPAPPPPKKEVVAAQPPPAPAPPPSPPPVLPKIELVAVAISPHRSEAILRLPTGKSSTMGIGDRLDDWVLAAVSPDHVTFRIGEVEAQVSFPVLRPARAPGPQFPSPGLRR
jgi:hypothetical protein